MQNILVKANHIEDTIFKEIEDLDAQVHEPQGDRAEEQLELIQESIKLTES